MHNLGVLLLQVTTFFYSPHDLSLIRKKKKVLTLSQQQDQDGDVQFALKRAKIPFYQHKALENQLLVSVLSVIITYIKLILLKQIILYVNQ